VDLKIAATHRPFYVLNRDTGTVTVMMDESLADSGLRGLRSSSGRPSGLPAERRSDGEWGNPGEATIEQQSQLCHEGFGRG
jgi:hypothetical protein